MNIKKKTTKFMSLLLSFVMAFSGMIPAYAMENTSDNSTTVIDGENISTEERNLEDITVTYKQASSFFVTIPKTIVLDGWKQSTYAVKVSGDIGSEQCVYVAPVDMIDTTENIDFLMKDQASENAKDDVVASVTHNKFHWNATEVAAGHKQADNLVEAPDLTAGAWRGIFQMEIKLETHVTHKHNYVETITKEPTCTETGEKKYTCDCGNSYTEVIPAKGHHYENGECTDCHEKDPNHEHSYTEKVTKEPTCTEKGEKTYTCTCGHSYTEEIPATGHHYGDDDKCTGCGELNPDHEHSYTETITKEATTTEEGEKTYTCKCGESYTEAIPAIKVLTTDGDIVMGAGETAETHAYINGEIVDSEVKWMSNNANITVDNGVIKTKASAIVGETADITVVAKNETDIVSAKSVLSKLGIMDVAYADDALTASFTVTVIDIEFSKNELNIYPGESDTVTATIIPTSIEGTVIWSRTAVSGINLVRNGNTVIINISDDMATGKSYDIIATYGEFSKRITVNVVSPHIHNYVATITKEANCTETGVKTFTCDCEDTYTEIIPALGHNYASTYTTDVEATCTVEGSKSKHCSRCNAKTDVAVIPVIEHRYVDNTNLVSWENTSNGTYAFIQEGTKWTSNNKGVQGKAATSTWTITLDKDAEYTLKYKVSSEANYDKLTVKLDSTTIANAISGAGEEITYTTTLAAGTHTLTATYAKDSSGNKNDDCGYVVLEDVGESNHKCTYCGNKEAHDYQEIIKEATCTVEGSKYKRCSKCEAKTDVTVIPVINHNYVNGTCTMCGKTVLYNIAPNNAYSNWNYTLDDINNIITLNYYTGSETDVIVYANYAIGGKTYKTQLASNVDSASVNTTPYMFNAQAKTNCNKIKTIKFSNGIDTSNVTNMRCMFGWCSALTSLDISGFDTSNVTNMANMFCSCQSLTSLDLSNFDTSNVTNMSYMFNACTALTDFNISSFDTSKVTDMCRMFFYCKSLTSLDVSNFNTSKVTDMGSMFSNCIKLTRLDLSNFDTSNVTDMSGMFSTCIKLTGLNLSNFNTSNVTDMSYMFITCRCLTSLDLSNFNTSKVTNMCSMFDECLALTSLDLRSFNTSRVTDMSRMFYKSSSLKTIYVTSGKWSTSQASKTRMFESCGTSSVTYK